MRSVISNVRQDCCCNQKLEFVFDALEKDDLEDIVQFLYSGQILFTDQAHAAKVLGNLTKYLGFPEMVNPEGDIKQEGIKVDEDVDLTFDYGELTEKYLTCHKIGWYRGRGYSLWESYWNGRGSRDLDKMG